MKTPKMFLRVILAYLRKYTINGHHFTELLTDHDSKVAHRPGFVVLAVTITGAIEVVITTSDLIFHGVENGCVNERCRT